MLKVLIATGGTGGHIYPAIALGEFLKENNVNVVFTGRKNSMEEDLIKKRGFDFICIDAKRFKGESFINKIGSLCKMFFLIFSGIKILSKEKVNYIIGTGGYVAAPLVFAGILKKIPTGICEQNALMGFGNKILSVFVKDIFLTFNKTRRVPFHYKSIATGNYIRKEFGKKRGKGILIFGGSQGAVKINDLFCSILDKLDEMKDIKIFHITGKKDFERITNIYKKNAGELSYEVYPFYDEMYNIFKKVDIVIGRAGATSVSEIYYTDKKAVLIPYPYAADNHQWYNGLEFCKTGRGVMLKESNLNEEKLLKWIKFFINNSSRFNNTYEPLAFPKEGKRIILQKILEAA